MDFSQVALQLESDDVDTRCAAAEQLCQLGSEAQSVAVPLVRAAADEAEEVREWVVSALEELGPPAVEDAAAIAELVGDNAQNTAYWAATLLGRLEDAAAPGVGQLVAALQSSPHASVRQRAAWALGKVGPAAKDAAEALQSAARSDDPRLARLAVASLEEIGQ